MSVIGKFVAALALCAVALGSVHAQQFVVTSPDPYKPITNRGSYGTNLVLNSGATGGGTATQFQERHVPTIMAQGPFTTLKIRFGNFTVNPAPALVCGLDVLTLRVGIFLPNGSGGYQSTGIQGTWPGGGIDITLQPCDYADATFTLPTPLNQNDAFLLSEWGRYNSAIPSWPGSFVFMSQSAEAIEFGTALTDKTISGTISTRPTLATVLPPLVVRGIPAPSNNFRAIIDDSDSIGSGGNNDSTNEMFPIGASLQAVMIGWGPRGVSATSTPLMNAGAGSNNVSYIAGTAAFPLRYYPLVGAGFTHVVLGAGDADLGAGLTASQLYGLVQSLANKLNVFGIHLVVANSMPRTNSTNDGKFGTDGVGVWAQRLAYNQMIRDNNGVGYGYVDIAACSQDATNNNLWRTDLGTPTNEGIHPNSGIHTACRNLYVTSAPAFNFLLKRDLDPASNDNDPMFLEKAA